MHIFMDTCRGQTHSFHQPKDLLEFKVIQIERTATPTAAFIHAMMKMMARSKLNMNTIFVRIHFQCMAFDAFIENWYMTRIVCYVCI